MPRTARHPNLLLDHQLCFALYAATNSVVRAYRERLKTVGLTYPQYLVMLVLWERGATSVHELATTLKLDAATVSPIVKRLHGMGFVDRRRNEADERRVDVTLTAAGADLEDRVAAMQRAVATQTGLSHDEFEALRTALLSLSSAMTANAERAA